MKTNLATGHQNRRQQAPATKVQGSHKSAHSQDLEQTAQAQQSAAPGLLVFVQREQLALASVALI
jgi:hypothetical protein